MEQFCFSELAFGEREKTSLKKESIILVEQGWELDPGNAALCCGENKGFLPTSPMILTNNTQLYFQWL